MSNSFTLHAPFKPTGDRPQAIDAICAGLARGERFQTLEGVTGYSFAAEQLALSYLDDGAYKALLFRRR